MFTHHLPGVRGRVTGLGPWPPMPLARMFPPTPAFTQYYDILDSAPQPEAPSAPSGAVIIIVHPSFGPGLTPTASLPTTEESPIRLDLARQLENRRAPRRARHDVADLIHRGNRHLAARVEPSVDHQICFLEVHTRSIDSLCFFRPATTLKGHKYTPARLG
jgi:hypothetical protein